MSPNTFRLELSLDSGPKSTVFDIRATAKEALADVETDLDTGAPVVPFDDWWPRALRREPLLAQTVLDLLDGKCLGTIGFIACGEGGNYCSEACLLHETVRARNYAAQCQNEQLEVALRERDDARTDLAAVTRERDEALDANKDFADAITDCTSELLKTRLENVCLQAALKTTREQLEVLVRECD